jgi:hypothetical protein
MFDARPTCGAARLVLRALVISLGLASPLSCGSHPNGGNADGGNSSCASGDVDCLLSNLVVQQGGAAVPLQTIASSRLSPSGPAAVLPFVWAVGQAPGSPVQSLIAGWDGTHWTAYPNPAPSIGLKAVWTFATNDAWAAGTNDTVLHWDGMAWSVVTFPAGSGVDSVDAIVGLWGDTPDDLWAVTAHGKATHFTGTWSPFVPVATNASLAAVWGFGANDVWAVGVDSTGTAGASFHYDGTAWTTFYPGTGLSLTGIWGDASADVWAIAGSGSSGSNAIFHWRGSSWSADAAPVSWTGPYEGLSLSGTGPNDVWQCGYNIAGGIVAHDDGTGWTVEPRFDSNLQCGSLWAAAKNDVWMVSSDLRHWDGTKWAIVAGPAGTYSAVRGATPGSAAAGPPSFTSQPPPITLTGTSLVSETFDWSDPSGCRPSFCFSLCNASLKCSTAARCSSPVHDGLLIGQAIFQIGTLYGPADSPASYTLDVTPVSSAGCQDPIPLLADGSAGPLVGTAVSIDETLTTPTTTGTGSSIVGTWKAMSTTTSGAATTTATTIYTFNSDGSDTYSSISSTDYSDGTPSGSSPLCTAGGTYSTSGSTITITTPIVPADCGTILSPYTTTYSISGSMLQFGGDPQIYFKQ